MNARPPIDEAAGSAYVSTGHLPRAGQGPSP
jgi:hypothetical protein